MVEQEEKFLSLIMSRWRRCRPALPTTLLPLSMFLAFRLPPPSTLDGRILDMSGASGRAYVQVLCFMCSHHRGTPHTVARDKMESWIICEHSSGCLNNPRHRLSYTCAAKYH